MRGLFDSVADCSSFVVFIDIGRCVGRGVGSKNLVVPLSSRPLVLGGFEAENACFEDVSFVQPMGMKGSHDTAEYTS